MAEPVSRHGLSMGVALVVIGLGEEKIVSKVRRLILSPAWITRLSCVYHPDWVSIWLRNALVARIRLFEFWGAHRLRTTVRRRPPELCYTSGIC